MGEEDVQFFVSIYFGEFSFDNSFQGVVSCLIGVIFQERLIF